nr:MAG TPA: hypothetical protein [Caudoviricetes sp.]
MFKIRKIKRHLYNYLSLNYIGVFLFYIRNIYIRK